MASGTSPEDATLLLVNRARCKPGALAAAAAQAPAQAQAQVAAGPDPSALAALRAAFKRHETDVLADDVCVQHLAEWAAAVDEALSQGMRRFLAVRKPKKA